MIDYLLTLFQVIKIDKSSTNYFSSILLISVIFLNLSLFNDYARSSEICEEYIEYLNGDKFQGTEEECGKEVVFQIQILSAASYSEVRKLYPEFSRYLEKQYGNNSIQKLFGDLYIASLRPRFRPKAEYLFIELAEQELLASDRYFEEFISAIRWNMIVTWKSIALGMENEDLIRQYGNYIALRTRFPNVMAMSMHNASCIYRYYVNGLEVEKVIGSHRIVGCYEISK